MVMLQDGQIVRGTYEVERYLGEGAFAEVYRVKHRFLGRQAMKVFKSAGMSTEETEQLLGEAILLSKIGHPNIVRVFDANITETSKGVCGFFTMEYVAGGSLEQLWRSYGTRFVPVEMAVEITRQVCRGLAVAHAENPPIIHRDIKPQNIMIGYDAEGLRARVTDFGLAKEVNPLTLMASARGTRCFKSPEAFKDFQSDSCAGDVWALGSTLYLLLADRLPYCDVGELDVFDPASFNRSMLLPSKINLEVDPLLDRILITALACKPEERYLNAQAMLSDLEKWKPNKGGNRSQSKGHIPLEMSKNALGAHTPISAGNAKQLADTALQLSKTPGKLMEAADLMEEAFNKCPDLRGKYEYQLKLWRRGMAM